MRVSVCRPDVAHFGRCLNFQLPLSLSSSSHSFQTNIVPLAILVSAGSRASPRYCALRTDMFSSVRWYT